MPGSLRKYPFPYQSMLAICSDLDETPNKAVYFETIRYLNTDQDTLLGKGVNLEVGNSIYFSMPEDQFSYLNTDAQGRLRIHQLIASGHIDCLHSFGDFVSSREEIQKYWQILRHGSRHIEVWIDHAQSPSNFDTQIMHGLGAIYSSKLYHCDITCQSGGLAFIWKGRVTSVVAQNSAHSIAGIFNPKKMSTSFKTMALEKLKYIFGVFGSKKYRMHQRNDVLRKTHLHDGTKVYEFMRSNPSYAGVSRFDCTRGIHKVLNKRMLDTLVKKQGVSILYTHLGKIFSIESPFIDVTRQAFELLASYAQNKKILVASTRRLLGYLRTQKESSYYIEHRGETTIIHLNTPYQGEDISGLTWYVKYPENVQLYINDVRFLNLQINVADQSGQLSVSIPWLDLHFPSENEGML
ncbi:hypothetical protein PCNPT3_01390 [Psychromonas sp. CNPT3]|uniref:hypothetical protein n=1 Tax=Psychromonas sp. CNPT3 TaxID=314282 RepID=UPI00006E9573|nr:hypothetical protein [Psychromonas sp. CNPT3]AGH80220.1 hypothetical protein PCNPT3_01390 [Psychromonas sp. CNPT3]